ncbi:MAG TPA: hypothetical protein VL096_09575 [Pirellulaceae bacterium]|nr:hypothetical protein [Pirellulaceae bacterium]
MPTTPEQLEEEPAHIQRARASLLRPNLQFTMRTMFIATAVVALLSLGIRLSTGRVALELIPLLAAVCSVGMPIAFLYWGTRFEAIAVGGLAPICGVTFLALVSLWLREGIDQANGAGAVNWERVRLSEFLWPYLLWSIAFTVIAGLGMATTAVYALVNAWRRRLRKRITALANSDRGIVNRARLSLLRHKRQHTIPISIGIGLLFLANLSSLVNPNSVWAADQACWFCAILTTFYCLLALRQQTGIDRLLYAGTAVTICLALATTFPIWSRGGRTAGAMVGYVQLINLDWYETVPLPAIAWTYAGWLAWFLGYTGLGVALTYFVGRLPRRRRLQLRTLPVELPPTKSVGLQPAHRQTSDDQPGGVVVSGERGGEQAAQQKDAASAGS